MTKRFRLFILLGFFCLLSGAIGTAGSIEESRSGEEGGDLKARTYAAIAAQAEKIKTLSSDFSQERHLEILKSPLISEGRFFYEKPDRLYWEVRGPKPMGFTVQGQRIKRWMGNPGNEETLGVEEDPLIQSLTEQIFCWSRADFGALEKRYRIQVAQASTVLRLTPLSARERKFISQVQIAFDPDWLHVRSVEIRERGGDFTRIVFRNTRLNPSLPDDLWKK